MLLLFVMVKAGDNFALTTANFKARLIIARIDTDTSRTQKTKLEADLEQSGATK